MNIDGLGDKLVEQMVDTGLIENVADIYSLNKEQIAALERMADKSAQNIIAAIENSRKTTLARFIYALGIPNVGEHMGKVLEQEFKDLETLIAADYERLETVEGIGPIVAHAIRDFFDEENNLQTVKRLLEGGVSVVRGETGPQDERFAGKTFVFTGTLTQFTRSEAQGVVEKLGGKASTSVSKMTDYVVVGKNAGSKAIKARELGVKILTEDEFREMIGKVK
jgi:DNA ligase (NAD+)